MKRILLAAPVAALLASPLLVDCKQLEIHCTTAKNCLDGQLCVSGLCEDKEDVDGGGTGGASGTGGHGTGGVSGTGGMGGTGGSGSCTDDAHCGPTCAACSGGAPRCDGTKCVQCTQKSDCSGLTPCCTNNVCTLGAC